MINVLVYALPNRTSGGYSVVANLYEDVKIHKDSFPDIHWFFIVGTDGFESTDNITVINDSWALSSYFHRLYYNIILMSRFVKEHDIKVVISLNMKVTGLTVPSIISLHNVLPLYKCGSEVFDNKRDIIKQSIINHMINKSLRAAEHIIVPSKWIKEALVSGYSIAEDRISVSPISTPEIGRLLSQDISSDDCCAADSQYGQYEFIYPASGYPYKNHRVIVDAVKQLLAKGINNFRVRFAGNVGNGKTICAIQEEINRNDLPIEFCGNLSKDELAKSYREGTLLFPSKIETDGFPLLESMSCGGYIIAADLPYAREALSDYNNYALFNPDDVIRLADLMCDSIKTNMGCKPELVNALTKMPRSSVIVPMIRSLAK